MTALHGLGHTAAAEGRLAEARAYLAQALGQAHPASFVSGTLSLLTSLDKVLTAGGAHDRAQWLAGVIRAQRAVDRDTRHRAERLCEQPETAPAMPTGSAIDLSGAIAALLAACP